MLILQYNIYDENNENNPATKWIDGALTGKVNNCYKRMKTEWVPKLMDDASVSAISASKDDFVSQVTNHSLCESLKRSHGQSGHFAPGGFP